MPFVKLDTRILNSTIWAMSPEREIFITALLMAEPKELTEPVKALNIRDLNPSGFVVPPGWYGFIEAAGPGIVDRARIPQPDGMLALEKLATPEPESRSQAFDGRRMVRVDGGYVVLNFDAYRQKDHTSAERSRRYRERRNASRVENVASRVASRSVTQAEAEAEAEAEAGRGAARRERKRSLPATLDTPAFRSAWESWLTHWGDAHHKSIPMATADSHLKTCLELG